ncbi:MAG: PcfJ domain-containing protein [Oscillospiraceae bacterium]|nr:PcfJ domain-containing protein [Oscillospiraceae bacterium]
MAKKKEAAAAAGRETKDGAPRSSRPTGTSGKKLSEAEKVEAFLKSAPKLRQRDVDEINGLFKAYAFVRRGTGEVWTTCCRRHAVLPKGHELLDAEHTPEPRYRYSCHGYVPTKIYLDYRCPYCGARVTVKELRYSGQRKNLFEEVRIVLLRRVRGVLWAEAAWCVKDYHDLLDPPKARAGALYRFGADGVTWCRCHWYYGYSGHVSRARYDAADEKTVDKPFQWRADFGMGYDVCGWDALDGTPVEYCGIEEFAHKHGGLIGALCVAYAYPRQFEMLHKMGLDEVIHDRAVRGVKNVRLLNWDEPDPRKAFGMSREELREAIAEKANRDDLLAYKRLRKHGLPTRFSTINAFRAMTCRWRDVIDLCVRYRLPPGKLQGYVCNRWKRPDEALYMWRDYIGSAQRLGWALDDETVLLPKRLRARHDEAAAEYQAKLDRERAAKDEALRKAATASLKKRHRMYDFAMNGFAIRIADSTAEILREGRELKHCVGGYAERHLQGKTTILFLRRADAPDTPLYTIEMHGATLVQIHGYRNEGDGAPDPKKVMAWLLSPWLAWIAAGSHRHKDGTPALPETVKSA